MSSPNRRPRSPRARSARRIALRAGAVVASASVHAVVATTLLVAPTPIDRARTGTNELEWVEFEAPPPEPPAEPPSVPEPVSPTPTASPTVHSREHGLRVRAPSAPERLSLGRYEGPSLPFEFRERLHVGRYTPHLASASAAVRSATRASAADVGLPATPVPGEPEATTVGAPPISEPPVTAALPSLEPRLEETTPTETPIALEPAPPESVPETATPTEPATSTVAIVASGHADLAALRALGNGGAVSRGLAGLGLELLPLLGLEAGEVLASADVRAPDTGGRAIAIATALDAAALRQRIEGAAIARGTAPVFGDSPLPASATLTVAGRSYTLALDGARLVVGSRPSARLLREGLSALEPELADAVVVAERIAPPTLSGPTPTRLLAALRVPREDASGTRLRLAFVFATEAEAETARTLGTSYLEVARRALGLPEAAITLDGEPELDGSTLVVEATPERMGAADLAVRLARAD